MIEGHRLGEISFENSVVRTSWRGPERVRIAIERGFRGLAPDMLHGDQVHRVSLPDGSPELFEALYIQVREKASFIRSKSKHQLTAAPD